LSVTEWLLSLTFSLFSSFYRSHSIYTRYFTPSIRDILKVVGVWNTSCTTQTTDTTITSDHAAVNPGDAATVALTPATHQLNVGETATLTLSATNLENIQGFEFILRYNSEYIEITKIELAEDMAGFSFAGQEIDLATGTATFSAFRADASISGDQDLVVLTIAGKASGESAISFDKAILGSTDADQPIDALNGSTITVNAETGATGDVSCDSKTDPHDALFILQYDVGLRAEAQSCPAPENTLLLAACDVNQNGACEVLDALWLLQCDVGLNNNFCPAEAQLSSNPVTIGEESATLTLTEPVNTNNDTLQITLHAQLHDHTLGAATIELHYDPAQVTITGCTADPDGHFNLALCNPTYGEGVARLSLVSSAGVTGEAALLQLDYTTTGQDSTTPFTAHALTFAGPSGAAIPLSGAEEAIFLPLIQR
jgi:hypothetical protein